MTGTNFKPVRIWRPSLFVFVAILGGGDAFAYVFSMLGFAAKFSRYSASCWSLREYWWYWEVSLLPAHASKRWAWLTVQVLVSWYLSRTNVYNIAKQKRKHYCCTSIFRSFTFQHDVESLILGSRWETNRGTSGQLELTSRLMAQESNRYASIPSILRKRLTGSDTVSHSIHGLHSIGHPSSSNFIPGNAPRLMDIPQKNFCSSQCFLSQISLTAAFSVPKIGTRQRFLSQRRWLTGREGNFELQMSRIQLGTFTPPSPWKVRCDRIMMLFNCRSILLSSDRLVFDQCLKAKSPSKYSLSWPKIIRCVCRERLDKWCLETQSLLQG